VVGLGVTPVVSVAAIAEVIASMKAVIADEPTMSWSASLPMRTSSPMMSMTPSESS
jgi:hypothetical protein